MRHDDEPAVRGYAVTHPRGTAVLPQSPEWDQLVYAVTGVLTVETATGTWVVPPDRAVWVPAGIEHRIAMAGRTAVRTLYLRVGLAEVAADCRAVNVSPLLRELIIHAVRTSPLNLDEPRQARLIGVLLDQFVSLPTAPLQLPMPRDDRALRIARRLLADPGCDESIDQLSRASGSTRRTVERVFSAETGLSVGRWRQRARLVAALRLLAAGDPVTWVAGAVGYSTPSAFGAMFRAQMGVSPGRYFESPPATRRGR
jgi:AraC-like DNA-binding protein